jgi:talin
VAATISSPLCQEQLIESARYVTRSIEAVLQSCCPPITSESLFSELTDAGRTVRKTLNEFLLHIKLITDSTAANSDRIFSPITNGTPKLLARRLIATDEIDDENDSKHHDESIEQILVASDRLFSSVGDAAEMVKQAKILAQATAQLVSSLRQQAESVDDDTSQQKRFLSAAKMLADATAKMVESAKGCATKPNDTQLQYQLKAAVEELRLATNMSISTHIKRKVFKRVEQSAKYCASCATQCIAATSAAGMNNKTHQSYQELVQQCKIIADLIPKLVQSIRSSMIKPDTYTYQFNLLNTCEDFLHPAVYLTNLAKTVVPIIHDQSQALHLNNSSKQLTQALSDLRLCLNRVKKFFFKNLINF